MIWLKVYCTIGVYGGGRALAEIRGLLDYAGHRFTGCNVSEMTLLDIDTLGAM